MITKITKWGNSLAIRLPNNYIKQTKFKENESIELIVKNGSIIIKPLEKNRISMDELISNMTELDILDQYTDWGNSGAEKID